MPYRQIKERREPQNIALAKHMASPGQFGDLPGIAGRCPIVAVGPSGDEYYDLRRFSAAELWEVQEKLLSEGYLECGEYDEENFVQEWNLGPRAH